MTGQRCKSVIFWLIESLLTSGSYSPSLYSQESSRKSTTDSQETTALSSPADTQSPPPYSSEITLSPTSTSSESPSASKTSNKSQSTLTASTSASSSSTLSSPNAIRVHTKGDDLKSGFPYHPSLFDLHVRPDEWQRFSDQVTHAARFSSGDYVKMYAAAGSLALMGSIMTSAYVGR